MANNQKKLKAFVRYDGSGRVVASSLILRKNKPRVGRWYEIPEYLCCNGTSPSTTTTTTQGGGGVTPTAFIARIAAGSAEACGTEYGTIQIVYSASSTLSTGSYLYYDAALTQPVGGLLWVRVLDTTVVYTVQAGLIVEAQECSVNQEAAAAGFSQGSACASTTYSPLYYIGTLGTGTALFYDAELTQPYNPSLSGFYVKMYFQAEYQVCAMSGNIISAYTACSSII